MNCKEIDENLLWEYIDGELTPEQKKAIHDHFVQCPECEKEFKQLAAFDFDISEAVCMQPSLRFTKNVMERIEIELSTLEYQPLLRKFWRRLAASGFGTAILAILVVPLAFPSSGTSPFFSNIQQTVNQYTFLFQNTTIILLLLSVISFWGLFLFDKLMQSRQ